MVTQDVPTLVIAVLGLGEAGSAIAQDLVRAGVRVRGYDPAVTAADGPQARGAPYRRNGGGRGHAHRTRVPPLMADASRALHDRLARNPPAPGGTARFSRPPPFAKYLDIEIL